MSFSLGAVDERIPGFKLTCKSLCIESLRSVGKGKSKEIKGNNVQCYLHSYLHSTFPGRLEGSTADILTLSQSHPCICSAIYLLENEVQLRDYQHFAAILFPSYTYVLLIWKQSYDASDGVMGLIKEET